MGYSLGDVLKQQLRGPDANVSNLDTSGGAQQIEYIDIGLLDGDPRNRRDLRGLEELAANIELLGLRQPLRVRENPESPGRFIIVSGHRRRAALQRLVNDGRADFARVPCIRDVPAQSSALQELRLIFDNLDTQPYSSAEKAKIAARVEELLYLLKEEGLEFPGRMRDQVAAACKISAPKLARLKVIREKLVPQYMGLFEKGTLPEQTAYALARLPEDFQKRLANALSEVPSGSIAEKVLKKYNEGWRWEPTLQCPDGKPCKRGDTFLRRDCETHSWESFCGGNTCCLKCEKAKTGYSPCERMCFKAKAQRKAKKDAEEEAAHKRKQKNGRKYQKETQVYAKRLLPAIDAAGLPEEESIHWHWDNCTVADIRRWAVGEFDDPAGWSWARLEPGKCGEEVKVATLLDCTTDFLMGLADDFRPPAAPEPPAQEEPAKNVSNLDTLPEGDPEEEPGEEPEEEAGEEEPPVRCVRWESRGRTPPEGKPILTYEMTNDGPAYRPAVWEGGQFKSPNGKKVLSGLQFTQWLEIPLPSSGEAFRLEQAEGQLVFSGWMPGSSLPWEPCEAVADFRISSDGTRPKGTLRKDCWFDGENFLFKRYGAKIDAECIRWMAVPPVEDDVSKLDTNGEERP